MAKKKRASKQDGKEMVDDRFVAATTRPQFKRPQAQDSKVVLDDRFASVLTDPRFRVEQKDKYGRSKKKKNEKHQKAELSEFYTVDEKEEQPSLRESNHEESSASSSSSDESDNEHAEPQDDPASRIAYLTALSRGELSVSSSSDDESDSSEEDSDVSDKEDDSSTAGILDPSGKEEEVVVLTKQSSHFLAVLNMDWTHLRAVDLFSILCSFTPPGSVRRVQVFPSDFGMERMKKEESLGPSDLWKNKANEQQGDNDSNVGVGDNDSAGSDDEADGEVLDVNPNSVDSDFDPEKLRAYEASKLKYYFAVVEFSSSEHADVAYREVDGLELEHSSAAMDLRSIPPEELQNVIQGRTLRDEATALPSNYEPPDFVVSALQQTSVQCTWEEGNLERERKLTGYGNTTAGGWSELGESDDLRAYLASDVSSDEESGSGNEKRGSKMRKMLGLDSDGGSDAADDDSASHKEASSESESDSEGFAKVTTFVPGQQKLEDKIRSKLQSSKDESKELTPWQKYQEKRKEKKRERRRAARNKSKGITVHNGPQDDGMHGSDAEIHTISKNNGNNGEDSFFLDAITNTNMKKDTTKDQRKESIDGEDHDKVPSTKEELELLLAGDNGEELAKDYDMRGLMRISKNKDKKLRGSRKRKEEELAANVSGAEFRLDTKDERFAAVLEGTDDRFGIDRTDPNFKETPAMKEILSVQTKRRKAKKARNKKRVVSNVNADAGQQPSGGALSLSSLVKSLKSKVSNTDQ